MSQAHVLNRDTFGRFLPRHVVASRDPWQVRVALPSGLAVFCDALEEAFGSSEVSAGRDATSLEWSWGLGPMQRVRLYQLWSDRPGRMYVPWSSPPFFSIDAPPPIDKLIAGIKGVT